MTSLWSPWQVDPSPFADHGEMGSREGITARDVEPSRLGGGGIPAFEFFGKAGLLGGGQLPDKTSSNRSNVLHFRGLSSALRHDDEASEGSRSCPNQDGTDQYPNRMNP